MKSNHKLIIGGKARDYQIPDLLSQMIIDTFVIIAHVDNTTDTKTNTTTVDYSSSNGGSSRGED